MLVALDIPLSLLLLALAFWLLAALFLSFMSLKFFYMEVMNKNFESLNELKVQDYVSHSVFKWVPYLFLLGYYIAAPILVPYFGSYLRSPETRLVALAVVNLLLALLAVVIMEFHLIRVEL